MTLHSSTHTVAPTAPHTHTIIFLHGRGSNATTCCDEIFETQDSLGRFFTAIFPGIKWVFPCARKRWAITEEEYIHQWFDILSVQKPQEDVEVQETGLWESVGELLEVLRKEGEIVGTQNAIIAGISQGCATAVFALIVSGIRIGGFWGLCGWLPLKEELLILINIPRDRDVLDTPVLLQHCRDDMVVPVKDGEDLADRLRKLGMQVRWECFEDGGHWLNEPKGMDGVVRFIEMVIKRHDC